MMQECCYYYKNVEFYLKKLFAKNKSPCFDMKMTMATSDISNMPPYSVFTPHQITFFSRKEKHVCVVGVFVVVFVVLFY